MKKLQLTKKYTCGGLSVAEVVVVVAIVAVIGVVIGTFQRDVFSLNNSLQGSLNAQLESNRVLKSLVAELRSASPSSAGAYPIAQAATNTVTFYSDIDNDGMKEKVRYFVQSDTLKRGVIEPTGNPPVYTSTEEIKNLIQHIANGTTPMFYYYDSNYSGSTSSLPLPIDPIAVRLLKINVIIDKDANRPPGPLTVTSQVSLRNLKDNL